mgnify:CR=1 FL=1
MMMVTRCAWRLLIDRLEFFVGEVLGERGRPVAMKSDQPCHPLLPRRYHDHDQQNLILSISPLVIGLAMQPVPFEMQIKFL